MGSHCAPVSRCADVGIVDRRMTPEEVVSNEELTEVAGNANFGSGASVREVLKWGVLQSASGYTTGHTLLCIMEELHLVSKERRRAVPRLTNRGRSYLWAAFGRRSF